MAEPDQGKEDDGKQSTMGKDSIHDWEKHQHENGQLLFTSKVIRLHRDEDESELKSYNELSALGTLFLCALAVTMQSDVTLPSPLPSPPGEGTANGCTGEGH